MPLVGDEIILARMPGYVAGETQVTSDSSAFTTTETVVMTLAVDLILGVEYWIITSAGFELTTGDGVLRVAIREDSVSGTILGVHDMNLLNAGSDVNRSHQMVKYTALTTGSKTFVVTGDVISGTSSVNLNASSTNPSRLAAIVRS